METREIVEQFRKLDAAKTRVEWRFRLEAARTVIFHDAEIGEKAIAVGAGSYPSHVGNAAFIAYAANNALPALEQAMAEIERKDAEIASLRFQLKQKERSINHLNGYVKSYYDGE